MLTPDRPPPEDYYQNNCRVLLSFVREQYQGYDFARDFSLLDCIDSFLAAGDDAQRLFARLLTRKGPLFRVDSLNYSEVGSVPAAVAELSSLNLVARWPSAPGDDLLQLLRKAEILAIWSFPPRAKQWRKEVLMTHILSGHSDLQIRSRLQSRLDWVGISNTALWDLLRLLYFGDRVQDWSAFVLRDLGLVSYQDMPLAQPRLTSSDALRRELWYRRLSQYARRLDLAVDQGGVPPPMAKALIRQLQVPVGDRFVQRRRDKTLLRIAQWQEKQGDFNAALASYNLVKQHPARERQVRILHKLKRREESEKVLAAITRAPWCAEEAHFVQRFGKRLGGYQPPTTTVEVPHVRGDVEQQALEWLVKDGGWGAHVENSLVRTLTGLLYWPVIFAPVPGAFTNPFQAGPNDLYYEDFVQARQVYVQTLEQQLSDDGRLRQHLLMMGQEKHGLANQLVNWQMLNELPLQHIVQVMPAAHIRRLTGFLIRNLSKRRAGLPDLFVVSRDGSYEMVEVKGPNDQLQPGQRVWFEKLAQMQIPCRVLKLRLQAPGSVQPEDARFDR